MEKYKAEGTDSSTSVMWFINWSPALSYCSDWRCTEDCCSALHMLQARRWICIHWGTRCSAWERPRALSAPHALLRMQPDPWLAVPSAHSLENPEARPLCSSPLSLQQHHPGSSHSWGPCTCGMNTSDISVSPSALAGSICLARTHYTIICCMSSLAKAQFCIWPYPSHLWSGVSRAVLTPDFPKLMYKVRRQSGSRELYLVFCNSHARRAIHFPAEAGLQKTFPSVGLLYPYVPTN